MSVFGLSICGSHFISSRKSGAVDTSRCQDWVVHPMNSIYAIMVLFKTSTTNFLSLDLLSDLDGLGPDERFAFGTSLSPVLD
jgi:hypothetical protein